jgi:hypothetical protein
MESDSVVASPFDWIHGLLCFNLFCRIAMTNPATSKAEMMAQGGGPAASNGRARRGWWSVRVRRARYIVGCAWPINIVLLVAAYGWTYFFGQSRETIELMKALLKYEVEFADYGLGLVVRDSSRLVMNVIVGLVASGVALGTLILMLVSLFAGGSRFRTTRMWLVFTAVACGWLGLLVSWQSIYWYGQ